MGDLAGNGKLGEAAAQDHTNHMVEKGCFSHECPGEGGMSSRVKRTGYLNGAQAWGLGENIAAGEGERGSPAEMVAAWMNSPPHRRQHPQPKLRAPRGRDGARDAVQSQRRRRQLHDRLRLHQGLAGGFGPRFSREPVHPSWRLSRLPRLPEEVNAESPLLNARVGSGGTTSNGGEPTAARWGRKLL
jgi:hypothetical protein